IEDDFQIPNISESCSIDDEDKLHITMVNTSLIESYQIETHIADREFKPIKGSILTGDMKAHNTFSNPNVVKENNFSEYKIDNEGIIYFEIPPHSIVMLELEQKAPDEELDYVNTYSK
ncbi:MAG: hypothetical protein LBR68_03580, partial [Lachnoclostridium sp.]|nr:hypothetical protein [Lachnoclostridium sp.]